jgi:hypothetical protein
VKRRRYGHRKMCAGKRRHDTQAAARAHRDRLLAAGATRVTAYPCRHCGGWHVGHYRNP